MKNISPQLLSFLETHEAFNRADLFMIELPNGQCVFATSAMVPIKFGYPAQTYYPTVYGAWERGTVKSQVNFTPKANDMDLTVIAKDGVDFPVGPSSPQLMMPLASVVAAGLFDGAKVTVYTVYWGLDETPAIGVGRGFLVTFVGQIANFEHAGRSKIKFKVVDLLYLLNYNTPPNVIQSGCRYNLFDHGCTLVQSSFAMPNSVAAGSNSSYLNLVRAANTASFWNAYMTFSQGKLQFTSGYNNGLWYYVKSQVSTGQVQLSRPLLFPADVGDTFTIYPGCAKSTFACTNQYANLIHIGAMPYVPSPEYAL